MQWFGVLVGLLLTHTAIAKETDGVGDGKPAESEKVSVDFRSGPSATSWLAFGQGPWEPEPVGLVIAPSVGVAGQVGVVFDMTDVGDDGEEVRLGFGVRYQFASARSYVPESHHGVFGGYLLVDDCTPERATTVCGGAQLSVGGVVPYANDWSVVEVSGGDKSGQVVLVGSSYVQLPYDVYLMVGGGVAFGNARSMWAFMPTFEVGTAL